MNSLRLLVILTIVVGILFLYNVSNFLYYKYISKFKGTNSQYEIKNIEKYKRKLYFVAPIFMVLAICFSISARPIAFNKIINDKEQSKINVIFAGANFSDNNTDVELSAKDTKKVLDILNSYKYKRVLFDDSLGSEVIMLDCTSNYTKFIEFIGIWDNEYITLENGEVYKIIGKDKETLYDSVMALKR